MSEIRYVVLDSHSLEQHLPALRALDADQDWMAWDDDAYRRPLPRKWELSRMAVQDGETIGYALCSEKQDTLWLHRIVVGDRMRGSGVGADFLKEIESIAREQGYARVSLKTPSDNSDARRFYLANGYSQITSGTEYIEMSKSVGSNVVGVHQPNYVPWLGYFYKLARSDTFVILDDVLAPSRGYFNRSKVLVQGNPRWLSVPVHRGGGFIHRMTTVGDDWVAKHLGTLQHNYQRAPFFDALFPQLSDLLHAQAEQTLAIMNETLLGHIAGLLDISTPTVRSSTLGVDSTGDARLVELVQATGGTTYLSGRGGDNYQQPETFAAAGIDLVYTGFANKPYPQQGTDEFEGGLSALDALFNIGPEATHQLIDEAPAPAP